MQTETRFRLNAPNVIAEMIEGEAILVDLRTGNYYSIQGSGSQIWEAIARGATLAHVTEAVAKAFSIEPDEAPFRMPGVQGVGPGSPTGPRRRAPRG